MVYVKFQRDAEIIYFVNKINLFTE